MPPDSLDLQPPRVSGYGRVTASVDSAGRRLDVASRDGFWARLDSRAGAAYGWTERLWSGGGTWVTPIGARSGTTSVNPAYDLNGGVTATPGVIVWMTRGAWSGNTAGQDYRFSSCCVGTGSGSGTGGSGGVGGGIITSCCPSNGINLTLTATITAVSHADYNHYVGQTAVLTYNPASPVDCPGGKWSGTLYATAPANYLVLSVCCGTGIGTPCLAFTGSGVNHVDGVTPDCDLTFGALSEGDCSCDPFSLEFTLSTGSPCTVATLTLVITE